MRFASLDERLALDGVLLLEVARGAGEHRVDERVHVAVVDGEEGQRLGAGGRGDLALGGGELVVDGVRERERPAPIADEQATSSDRQAPTTQAPSRVRPRGEPSPAGASARARSRIRPTRS